MLERAKLHLAAQHPGERAQLWHDLWVVGLAACELLGARVALPVALPVLLIASAVGLAGLVSRLPLLALAAGVVLASGLSARALAGAHLAANQIGEFNGVVTLLTDPVREAGAVRVDVRAEGKHLAGWARGAAARAVAGAAAGE